MKNYLKLFVIAVSLMLTACVNNEDNNKAEEVDVTFAIGLNESGVARAIGDGSSAHALYYEIRREGNVVKKEKVEDAFTNSLTYNLTLSLVAGVTYEYIFWAQAKEAQYGTEDLGCITMNYENVNSNDEKRDAFCKAGSFVAKQMAENIVLKRPFAQLNVGTHSNQWNNAANAGVSITGTAIAIKQIPTKYYPLTGEATDLKDITFQMADTPDKQTGEALKVKIDNVENTYHYLSLNYILATEAKALHDLTVSVYDDKGVKVDDVPVPNVPLQRNYRTNILSGGFVGMSDVTFTITIDPTFNELQPETPDYNKPWSH